MTSMVCPKCSAPMVQGYLLELGDSNLRTVTQWVSGAPEAGAFMGMQVKGRDQFPTQSFRCSSCGFLESYARPTTGGAA